MYSTSLLALVLSGGAVQQNATVSFDSSLISLTFMLTYLVIGGLLLLRWKQVLRSLWGDWIILPLLVLAGLSFFWADAPDITLRRMVALIGTTMLGIYLATRYSLRQQLQLLASALGLVVVVSLVFSLALPTYGVHAGLHEGAWRGCFIHKNGLGMRMVTAATVFFLLALERGWARWLYALGFLTAVFLIIMTQSATALVTLVVVLVVLPIYKIFTLRRSLSITWGLLAALTVISLPLGYVWINLAQIAALLGKDLTLTGRLDIWAIVAQAIGQRPLLGYGYESFWRGLEGPSASLIYAGELGATHAHNGILELWLSLGFVGVVIFLCGFWINLLRSLAYLHRETSVESYWPPAFLTLLLLANVTESNIINYNQIDWVLYCALSISLLGLLGSRGELRESIALGGRR